MPVAVLLAVAPFGVTVVFGRAFEQAVVPAMILVVGSGVNAFNNVLEELLRGSGRPDATLFAEDDRGRGRSARACYCCCPSPESRALALRRLPATSRPQSCSRCTAAALRACTSSAL